MKFVILELATLCHSWGCGGVWYSLSIVSMQECSLLLPTLLGCRPQRGAAGGVPTIWWDQSWLRLSLL